MNNVKETWIKINGFDCRIWEKGSGEPIGYFAGIGGMPRWFPFLNILAERRRVICPSLPGFPGSLGHTQCFDHLDWLLATKDLFEQAGLENADVIGSSVAAPLIADIAGIWGGLIKKLILISPFGIFDEKNPTVDIWAQRPGNVFSKQLLERQDAYLKLFSAPSDEEKIEWDIMIDRASEAAARYLFPFGDTGLIKRLKRIKQPTLLLRGSKDQIIPKSYITKFADQIGGHAVSIEIANAGHLSEIDEPEEIVNLIIKFLKDQK